jgi:hypothetical protein
MAAVEVVGGGKRRLHHKAMKPRNITSVILSGALRSALVLAACVPATTLRVEAQEKFAAPEQAVDALVNAAKRDDTNAFHALFGPDAAQLSSRDPVQASNGFAVFVQRVIQKTELVRQSPSCIQLDLGADAWPMPIPLVNQGGQWFFDTAAGKEEILNRRVGMNELAAIRVCHAYVEAQREYAGKDRDGSGILQYAQHLRSTPGTHDGLYWHAEPEEEISPFGPLIAESHGEGYRAENRIMTDNQSAYRGYRFKILTRQGRQALCGKYDYIINGHMIGGFALVAWPEEWGNTGVMTFVVNQQNKVFQKNLGPKSARIAAAITTFDPDPSWQPANTP